MNNTRVFKMSFASVYPYYIRKAEKKGRTKAELDTVIFWLTGYNQQTLQEQIDKKTNTIKPSRLIPRRNPTNRRLETSVCRSSRLTEAQVWGICSAHFDVHSRKPAIGRGVGPAKAIFAEELTFDADGKPYPEHANIIDWHDDIAKPDSELKHFWMDQAQRMAKQFLYTPRR